MSTPKSRYQDSHTQKPVKAELMDSDTENDEPVVSKPFEAYEDSGFESVMFLENNSIKHYSVTGCENPYRTTHEGKNLYGTTHGGENPYGTTHGCENPYGMTKREPLSERMDQSLNRDIKQQPLTPTGTPIKNLPFSPSQVR